jgi:hypothetical protein
MRQKSLHENPEWDILAGLWVKLVQSTNDRFDNKDIGVKRLQTKKLTSYVIRCFGNSYNPWCSKDGAQLALCALCVRRAAKQYGCSA